MLNQVDVVKIPPDLVRFLGPGRLSPLGKGGSGALTLRHEHVDGERFIKYLPHRADAVDGHESHILRAKCEQVRLIHEVADGLRAAVPLVDVTEIATGYVLTAPFIVGRSPVETLLAGDVAAFASTLPRLLEILGNGGYSCRSSAAPPASDLYVGRSLRRLDYLAEHVAGLDRDDLTSIATSITRVACERDLLPARLYFPAHGDLNLLNVIETDGGELILIDQRGVLDDWDPIYDIAKMLTTLWIQVGVEFDLYAVPSDGRNLTCGRRAASLLGQGIEALRAAVSAWSFGPQIEVRSDRRWLRVLYAAAVHAICEAACRISVARSVLCAEPARDVAKAHAYLDLGRRLLWSVEHDEVPTLPMPRIVGP